MVAMQTAPLKAQKPTEDEVELAEVFTVEQVQVPVSDPASPQLPATASDLPLVGVIGLLCLATAFALRKASV